MVSLSFREALLSDEEAQEVVRLLSPPAEVEADWDKSWSSRNLIDQEKSIDETSKMITSMDDSFVSTRRGSHSESESGHLGSVSSLGDQVRVSSKVMLSMRMWLLIQVYF